MCGSRRSKHSNSIVDYGINTSGCIPVFNGHPQARSYSRVNSDLLYCFNCNTTLSSREFAERNDVKYCKNCGESIMICPISRNKFYTGNQFAQCPNCLNLFHYFHLTDWLKSNKLCPVCRQEISEIFSGTVGQHNIVN